MVRIEKVVLIEPRSPGLNFFSQSKIPLLGLPILGAILQKMGLRVRIFCENIAPINWQEVSQADLVGISALTSTAPRAYELVGKVKEIAKERGREILVVMGGAHPTFLPEESLFAGADFVVRREGEETLKELIENLQEKGSKDLEEINGLSYWEREEIRHNPERPLIEDFDQIPLTDFSLIEGSEKIKSVPLQTSRGCPKDCEFCSVIQIFGRKIRFRSPESVVKEMKMIPPEKTIFIIDDNFSAHRQRTIALLNAIKEADLKRNWLTQERVSIAEEPDILKLMKETGCVRVCQGLESLNPEALKEWNKGQTPEQIKEAIPIIHEYGISIHGMFVLGADADTPDTINQTINSAINYGLDTAQFFILVPPPGTRIHQRFEQEDRIIDRDWSHYDGQHVIFNPRQMSAWELQELSIKAFQKFYAFRRGVKWALKGKKENSFLAFGGLLHIRRWLKENEWFLKNLKATSLGSGI